MGGYPYVYGARPTFYSHPLVTKKVVTKAVDGEKKTVLPYVLPYGGLYNYGYGYHGYPVVKTVASHVIAKRDAEAEPAADAEAEADPWLAYGYHGYGLRPYGYRSYYGGYPYGYIWWLRISLLRISMLHTPDICTDTTQLCSESQSRHLESHLSKNSETKKV